MQKGSTAAGSDPAVIDTDLGSWPAAKRAVYDSALQLFYDRGYEATAVQDIVDAADLSKGALYHYFGSKDTLLQVTYEQILNILLPAFEEIRDSNVPVGDALERVMAVLFQTMAEHRKAILVFFEEWRHLNKEAFLPTKEKREEVEKILTDIIAAGIASGDLREVGPPRVLAFAIVGMCAYSQYWWDPSREYGPQGMAALFTNLVIGGLANGETPSKTPSTRPKKSGTRSKTS